MKSQIPRRGVEFCYVAHSLPSDHPYAIDHMNAHVRTEECAKHEERKRRRRDKRQRS